MLPRLTTAFIGDGGDNWMFAWNGWWVGHAVAHGKDPLYCDMQLTPGGAPLVYHTLVLPASAAMAALQPLLGGALAFNVVVLALFPFAGVSMFALALRVLRSGPGAFVAGLVFMLCPFMSSKALGHVNLLCGGLAPLFMLCLIAAVHRPRRAATLALAVVAALTIATDLPLTAFIVNVALWYWLWHCRRGRWRRHTLRFWRALLPTGVAGLAFAGVIVAYSLKYGARPELRSGVAYAPEPLCYVLPLQSASWWSARWAAGFDWRLGNLELAVYLGWAVLPLAVAGWWLSRRQRRLRWSLWFFIAATVLSLGPKLLWEREIVRVGGWQVRLPFSVYRYLPVVGAVGQTGRYMVIGYMGLAVGAGALAAALARRRGSGAKCAITAAAALLVVADFGFTSVAVTAPPQPIEPGAGRVLDARFQAWHSGIGLYYQMRHQRPLIGGYIARIPAGVLRDYAADPVLAWLFALAKDAPAPDCAQLTDCLQRLDVRYVTVNAGSPQDALLESCGWRRVHADEWGATWSPQ